MSKCKAVLDGDKITSIQVKTKAQKADKAGDKTGQATSTDKSKQAAAAAPQSK